MSLTVTSSACHARHSLARLPPPGLSVVASGKPPPCVAFCVGSGKTLAFLLPLVAHLHQQRHQRPSAPSEAAADHSTDSNRSSAGLETAAELDTNGKLDAAKKRQRKSSKQAVASTAAEPADAVPDSKLDRTRKNRNKADGAVQLRLHPKGSRVDKKKSKDSSSKEDTAHATLETAARRTHGAADHSDFGPIRNRAAANGPGPGVKSPITAPSGPGAVVLAPSRELAAQTARCLLRLVKGLRLHCCLLTAAVAAGTDFDKVFIWLIA